MTDASFEDGAEQPLRLIAADAEDLQVLSSLVQDAVFPISETKWEPGKRRFTILLNRFRWEDRQAAQAQARPVERVQSVLAIGDVTRLSRQGVDPADRDLVLSLLSLSWEPGDDGTGALTLTLSGDGAIRCDVECLNIEVSDVSRPYAAPSGQTPSHPQ